MDLGRGEKNEKSIGERDYLKKDGVVIVAL